MVRFLSYFAALFVVIALLPLNPAQAKPGNSPVGTWTTIDDETGKARSIVRITERGGVLYGTVVRVFKQPGDKGVCEKCPGRFKNKTIQGMTFMWGLRKAGDNSWSGGQILDPKSGKIYRVKLSLTNNGRALNVRGYIGVSMLGRTQTWQRR